MELDEFHIRDDCARAPRHSDPVAGRDIGIRCVKINLAATAGRQHQPICADRFHFAAAFIENVDTQATIFGRESELARCDQVERHVIFQQLHLRRSRQLAQQRFLHFQAGHVLHMQHPPLRMPAFASQVRLAMPANLAIVEVQPELDELRNPFRSFHHNRPHGRFVAKPGPSFERIRHMQLE